MNTNRPLLELRDLRVELIDCVPTRALVHDVSLTVNPGQSVGLVGESGSGKSMTIKAAMRLLPDNARAGGQVEFDGDDVMRFGRKDLAHYRSADVAMVYQDPRAHTNPMHTVGRFLTEGVVSTGRMSKAAAQHRAIGLLKEMGIGNAEQRMGQYPHQLSGGLLQRVMIAAALMGEPRLLFADEPTTALDVTVQSEVMAILMEQIRERGLGMVFVTHDLDLAAAVTDTLAVMYAGRIVETGRSEDVYRKPRHPYTAALLASRPSTTQVRRLVSIPGRPAAAYEAGDGCAFAARCPFAADLCRTTRPEPRIVDASTVACHFAEDLSSALSSVASA